MFGALLGNTAIEKRVELAETIVRASLSQTSLNDAWEARPGEYSRRELSRTLNGIDLARVESVANQALWRLARRHLPRRFALSVDLTDIPYHGEVSEDSNEVVRGQAKDGTTWKHRYVTAYVSHSGHRFTLAAYHVSKGTKPHEALRRVIDRLDALSVLDRIEVVLADKGFYSVDAIRCLKKHDLALVVPMQNKATLIKQWCKENVTRWESFRVGNVWAKHERVRVALVHVSDRGKKPPETFAYATHGIHGAPERAHTLYLKRGGIETSYKLSNATRARTSTRRLDVRVLYFALSMILQNAWVRAKLDAQDITTRFSLRAFLREVVPTFTLTPRGTTNATAEVT